MSRRRTSAPPSKSGGDIFSPSGRAPSTKRRPGRPPIHDEAWTKVTVVLFNRQIVFLDRVAANIRAKSGAAISRAQLIARGARCDQRRGRRPDDGRRRRPTSRPRCSRVSDDIVSAADAPDDASTRKPSPTRLTGGRRHFVEPAWTHFDATSGTAFGSSAASSASRRSPSSRSALGIGATSAIFAVVESVLLRPLPYTDPGRLVVVPARPRRHLAGFPR